MTSEVGPRLRDPVDSLNLLLSQTFIKLGPVFERLRAALGLFLRCLRKVDFTDVDDQPLILAQLATNDVLQRMPLGIVERRHVANYGFHVLKSSRAEFRRRYDLMMAMIAQALARAEGTAPNG